MNLKEFWKPYTGAVSLTFDDGKPSQLEKAIPAMDKLGIKGSFYLTVNGSDWKEDIKPWIDVAGCGHEIGNHTFSHVCSNNFTGKRGGLEDKTLDQIETDILTAQNRLVKTFPDQQQWTFCYPCYLTYVGRGVSRQSYVPVVAKHFLAGRSGGEYGFGNHPATVDLACAWGLSTDRMSGPEMIGLVEQLTAQGRWVILVFHEINGKRLTVGGYEFNMLLNYLHRNSDRIWTAPMGEVAGKISEFQNG